MQGGHSIERVARRGGFRVVAGVDEAGRGPWAGPVVAAAVILHHRPRHVRLDDSKRLTPLQREKAFHAILERAAVGIGILGAEEIDRWNILQATRRAMQQALHHLPVRPDLVLVDGPIPPEIEQPCWPIVHGDQRCVVISCASIVAKVLRDRLMRFYDTLAPQYAFARHQGYGTSLHAQRLAQWGPSVFHRLSFRPVRDTCSLIPSLYEPASTTPPVR